MSSYYEEYVGLSKEDKHRLYEIENDNSFNLSDEICCPYCDTLQDIEGEDLGYEQDEETERTCRSFDCGKKFTIITSVSYSWATSVPEEEALEMLKDELKKEQSDVKA